MWPSGAPCASRKLRNRRQGARAHQPASGLAASARPVRQPAITARSAAGPRPFGNRNEYREGHKESDHVFDSIVEPAVVAAESFLEEDVNFHVTREVDRNESGSITAAIVSSLVDTRRRSARNCQRRSRSYKRLSTEAGATRMARRAGIPQAASPTRTSSALTPSQVRGSVGSTPNS